MWTGRRMGSSRNNVLSQNARRQGTPVWLGVKCGPWPGGRCLRLLLSSCNLETMSVPLLAMCLSRSASPSQDSRGGCPHMSRAPGRGSLSREAFY